MTLGGDLAGTDGAVPWAITVVKVVCAVDISKDCFLVLKKLVSSDGFHSLYCVVRPGGLIGCCPVGYVCYG